MHWKKESKSMVSKTICRSFVLICLSCLLPSVAGAQAIDCDQPAPTAPGVVTSGRPYTVAFCVPSTVDVKNPDGTVDTMPVRIDGFTAQLDANAPVELGKLALGTPSPTLKLSAVSFRSSSGTAKGSHNITVTPWNYPLGADGVTPDTTKPPQKATAVAIPFVATDLVLTTSPPPIQKGRVIK